jgi:hypothetical protein
MSNSWWSVASISHVNFAQRDRCNFEWDGCTDARVFNRFQAYSYIYPLLSIRCLQGRAVYWNPIEMYLKYH